MLPDRGAEKGHIYAADRRWWKYHLADVMRDFDGECWTQQTAWEKDKPQALGLRVLESHEGEGLHTEPGHVYRGRPGSSGYQAVNLAYHLGADLIILLGYDMQHTGGALHWFGAHPSEINTHRESPERFIHSFQALREAPVKIINATRTTAITAFPRANLDDLLF